VIEVALFAQLALWLVIWGVFLASRQASLFHPLTIYLAFHGVVFVARPFLVHFLGFDTMWIYMGIEPTEQQFVKALEVSSFALVVFSCVSLMVGWSKTDFNPLPTFRRDQVRALMIVTVILAPFIVYSIKSSLSGDVKGEHLGGTFVMTGVSGYAAEAQYMAGPLICAWLAVTRFKRQVLLVLLPYVFYRSYAGWSRWTLILLFVSIALIYAWIKRMKWPPNWALVGALPLMLLFNALGHNREYFQQILRGEEYRRPLDHPGAALAEKWKSKYDGPDFANFDFLTFIIAVVPERTGMYTYGSQYLTLFTEPIPRKLWPGKPVGAPVRSFNLNQYGNFIGMTLTLPGDGWMSGGWLGLGFTMAMAGGILGLFHRRFWGNSGDHMKTLAYLVGLAMLPQWFRDGGISIAKFLFWNLSPLVLWGFITWLAEGAGVPVEVGRYPTGASLRLIRAGKASTEAALEDETPLTRA
jgi:hypothetical protein